MSRSLDPRRVAGLSGIAFVVLFATANALWAFDTPRLFAMPIAAAPVDEILAFYRGTSGAIVAGAMLSLLAIAVFVLFAAALRRVLIEAEADDLLGTTAFGGALLAMAAGLGAETLNMVAALLAREGKLGESVGQSLFEISQVLGFNAAGAGLGLFLLATGAAALRTSQVLPRWLAFVGVLVGISLITPLSRITLALSLAVLALIGGSLLRSSAGGQKSLR